jgi:hypothetical protein
MGTGPEGRAADLLLSLATFEPQGEPWPGYRALYRNGSDNMKALGRACGIWLEGDPLAIELELAQVREELSSRFGGGEQFSATYDDLTLFARVAALEWTTRVMDWQQAPALHSLPGRYHWSPEERARVLNAAGVLHAGLVSWWQGYIGIARRFVVRGRRRVVVGGDPPLETQAPRCYLPGMRCKDTTSPARDRVLALLDLPLGAVTPARDLEAPGTNRNRYAPHLWARYRSLHCLYGAGPTGEGTKPPPGIGKVRGATLRAILDSDPEAAIGWIRLAVPMRFLAWSGGRWALWFPALPGGASHDTPQTAVVWDGHTVSLGRAPVRAMWPEGREQRVELRDGQLVCYHAAGHIADPEGRKRARLAPPNGAPSWQWRQSIPIPTEPPVLDRWIGKDEPVAGGRS